MRLLLVEDDPTYRRIEAKALEREGADCVVAHDLASARKWLADDDPDAVLLDLGLGDAHGLDSLTGIVTATDAPVIVVTGSPDEANRLELLRHGADDVLDKKDNVHLELMRHIRDAVARSQGRRQRQT